MSILKKLGFYFGLFIVSAAASIAFAQVAEIPEVDPFAHLLSLIMNFKSAGPIAIGMGAIVVLVQGLKKFAPEFKYKRFAVTILSVGYGVLLMISQGISVGQAVVACLLTGGGAVAIYEAFKGASAVVAPKQG